MLSLDKAPSRFQRPLAGVLLRSAGRSSLFVVLCCAATAESVFNWLRGLCNPHSLQVSILSLLSLQRRPIFPLDFCCWPVDQIRHSELTVLLDFRPLFLSATTSTLLGNYLRYKNKRRTALAVAFAFGLAITPEIVQLYNKDQSPSLALLFRYLNYGKVAATSPQGPSKPVFLCLRER